MFLSVSCLSVSVCVFACSLSLFLCLIVFVHRNICLVDSFACVCLCLYVSVSVYVVHLSLDICLVCLSVCCRLRLLSVFVCSCWVVCGHVGLFESCSSCLLFCLCIDLASFVFTRRQLCLVIFACLLAACAVVCVLSYLPVCFVSVSVCASLALFVMLPFSIPHLFAVSIYLLSILLVCFLSIFVSSLPHPLPPERETKDKEYRI